ncbi:suppressor of fused domain protein [Streptomyces sp. NPDC021020]|uniref:suppressor of fused domain protein n=1 Tax=Streptomyces sp. NPDC021020 TaxID=3365109 RepID=UPI0037A2DE65
MGDILDRVEERLRSAFGEPDARASVTFLGAERIEVLRFTHGELRRYATLGMSAQPMADPVATVADPLRGPRAEVHLTVRAGRADTSPVLRALATAAASPQVEGLVLADGNTLDFGEPLWPGAPFTAFLAAAPGETVPDLPLPEPRDPVRFFPLVPLTPAEAAYKRARGADALRAHWAEHGTDLADPVRRASVF